MNCHYMKLIQIQKKIIISRFPNDILLDKKVELGSLLKRLVLLNEKFELNITKHLTRPPLHNEQILLSVRKNKIYSIR